jgi:hypothetical protein
LIDANDEILPPGCILTAQKFPIKELRRATEPIGEILRA